MSKQVSKKYKRKPRKHGRSKSLFGGLFKVSRRRRKLFGIF